MLKRNKAPSVQTFALVPSSNKAVPTSLLGINRSLTQSTLLSKRNKKLILHFSAEMKRRESFPIKIVSFCKSQVPSYHPSSTDVTRGEKICITMQISNQVMVRISSPFDACWWKTRRTNTKTRTSCWAPASELSQSWTIFIKDKRIKTHQSTDKK